LDSGVAEQLQEALLRRRQVQALTGLPTSTLYRAIALREFPAPVRIGKRSVAWQATAVNRWISERIAASAKAAK